MEILRWLVLVYVDDIILVTNDSTHSNISKEYLHKCFHLKDLGSLKYLLGLEIYRVNVDISIVQHNYATDMLLDTGMIDANPLHPLIRQQHHHSSEEKLMENRSRYRRLIRGLNYLTLTRPVIAYFGQILSQFMQFPRIPHWRSENCLLHYIKGTLTHRIFFLASSSSVL